MTKENTADQKLRGGYYTPAPIANFLCKWGISSATQAVLEPSCGDGNFLEAAINRFHELEIQGDRLQNRIRAIELNKSEAVKAKRRAAMLGLDAERVTNKDFFHYLTNHPEERYDLVLGNPPFIRYQNFPPEHRDIAIKMMQDLGLNPNKLTNIWVPFLVLSAARLNNHGKLAMVIPAELFQVKYAAESRLFLSDFFQRITIVTFKKLVFPDIQQEVVLLLCEKKVRQQHGIRVVECEDMNDLGELDFTEINKRPLKSIDHSSEKWTKYFLEEEEILFLQKLKQDKRVISVSDLMDVEVGLVTGRNEFFMMTEEQINKWRLRSYVIPVVSRSNQLEGISFSEADFSKNSAAQRAIYLFLPPNKDFKDLPVVCQKYISYGEEQGFHTGYKTRIRKRWYITPSLWKPDAFALRQVGDYPKMIINVTDAASTDTIHRVRFKNGVNQKQITASFLNSLSFAFAEITGRSYGGGVLTFEPTEIEEIRLPNVADVKLDFARLDKLIRGRHIEEALDMVDEVLLVGAHGFKKREVGMLRQIWRKMADRRINRK